MLRCPFMYKHCLPGCWPLTQLKILNANYSHDWCHLLESLQPKQRLMLFADPKRLRSNWNYIVYLGTQDFHMEQFFQSCQIHIT